MNDVPTAYPPLVLAAQANAGTCGFAMSSTPRTGALLRTLAASKPGGRLLEIGTGVGVGASWLLDGMDSTAQLVTVEVNPTYAGIAGRVLDRDERCEIVVADAADWLASYSGPPFDFVFVDWRVGKFQDRAQLISHLAPGALYVGDDLLRQRTWPKGHGERVDRFLSEIVDEPDLVVTLLEWASGLVVAARRMP